MALYAKRVMTLNVITQSLLSLPRSHSYDSYTEPYNQLLYERLGVSSGKSCAPYENL